MSDERFKENSELLTLARSGDEGALEALIENNLIEGDMSDYGIYIKRVNGILADYNIDGSWWGVEKNGEMCMTGASAIEIANGEHYELVYSK